ncbi:GNAT family N-acetyltransferase [Paraburkholderia bryophila]|uniref:Ribosomal protein S18 acetylase RimI-like enzyme n=1 Tax=Paraburkholderia bryophila TaxID=420952 RepID=A0A329B5Y0_9BURK|nr:GNAT family N-acetyltransferase [Paraburkholderia bryophila]RAS15793.1 ribosomal protein S18 acetylase RimI-like enzyme [Paraburkholderia bryophila]
MTVEIREATYSDAETIARIHVLSWQAAYRGIMPEAFLERLFVEARLGMWQKSFQSGKLKVLLAYSDEAVVGWIAFGACRDADKDETWAEVEALYILPEFWRRGIGERLSESACSLLRSAGFSFVALWVLSENHRARGFYHRIGFDHDDSSKCITVGGTPLTEIRYRCSLMN